ncbi:zinc finger C2HC domain-containing protein 1C-like isoform X1 [Homalodisca vitripennis]|uniref:zinc finger C2HC domain-containing protein 1C-like isoform X1 n=1 Tax=Homalodisca vitripennis TaxID=197043 RepID=UPI001EEA4465|nr:zinc finger C2HC domain-containing protein 1C-like isoform X1 [Homalodisca vitripennis]
MAPAKEQKVQSRIPEVSSITKAMSRMSPPSKKPEVRPVVATPNTKLRSSITPPTTTVKQRNSTIPTPTPTAGVRAPPKSTESNTSELKMNRGAVPKPGPRAPSAGVRSGAASGGVRSGVREPPAGARSDLVACKTCDRSFAPDRIQAHTEICAKTSRKKRKPFDPSKQRIKGTELEQYSVRKRPSQPPPSLAKSNWRKKHEEFISNIRAAKQAQAHVAKGGKLSDLPPPPPMDTSDLIPCPHCKRKFNEAAAERHIPKCANMLHNKPKPGPPAKGRVSRK